MEVLEFIILTWLTSFVPAAYCQMGNSSSEWICNVTIHQENDNPGIVLNAWQSKMIDRCPENYTNENIITSCERLDTLDKYFDFTRPGVLFPETNNITKISYMNRYCAYCNNENDTDWISSSSSSWEKFRPLEDPCGNYASKIRASEVDDLEKWIQTFLSDGMILQTSPHRSIQFQCSGKTNWPIRLLNYVIRCLIENYIYGQGDRLISCQYFNKNDRSCVKMDFIPESLAFSYRSKSYAYLSQINLTGGDYVVPTGNNDIFYLCKQIYKVGYWGKFVLIIASVAFLIIHLILNFNKRHFQILPNQLLYIYSIGLIVMYVLLTYIYLKFPISYVSFNTAKIFWTYQFIWATLILIVFFHLAFSICNRCENKSERGTNIFYSSILLFFGLLLPISLPIMYLNFLNSHENQCPLIPGHLAFTDIPSGNLQFMKFILNVCLGFLVPAIFLVGMFCVWRNKGDNGKRSARYTENSPNVLLKMLLIMGVHWVLYKLCSGYYGNENSYTVIGLAINMDTVAQLSIDIHGVLVFFVFLTDNTAIINDFLIKRGYKLGNTSRQNDNGATETTMQFQS